MSSRTSAAARAAQAIGVTLVVVLGLILAPAASASFMATRHASSSFSTATLPTPTASSISLLAYNCSPNKKTLTFSLSKTGALPFANAITVGNSATPVVVRDFSELPKPFTVNSTQTGGGNSVTFNFEIRTAYKIPNSSGNSWTSPTPMQVTHTCS